MTSTIVTTVTYSDYLFYLIVSVVCLILLVRMNKEFNPKELVLSFIKLNSLVVLFVLFISSLLSFMFEFLDLKEDGVSIFVTQIFKSLLYYCVIGYGTLYMIKLFHWIKKEFVGKNDLLYMSYFEKEAGIKVKKK